jgi:antigen flippase
MEPRPHKEDVGSYRTILRSTSLIGGASVINIFIGMVRTKFVAILLGPVGVGLLGLYTQITAVVNAVSGMGVATSGVRQVAEAVSTEDRSKVARTVLTLHRTAWVTGALGMLGVMFLCVPISKLTFGTATHAWAVAFLGVTILLTSLASAQSCVLRGTRRVGDVARVTVLGSLGATVVSIPCYYVWGVDGIVVGLVLTAVATLATSWWYARRVPVLRIVMSWRDSGKEAGPLLSLGINFMASALLATGATYVVQAILTRKFGVAGLGMYQAAFSLSGALISFVIGAMGADYYPRLTAVAYDDASVRRLMNHQAQVSVLLALPGLAAMMVFAPIVVRLFYARDFAAAVPILRWCLVGILGRMLSSSLGFVLLAKGKGRTYLAAEAFSCALQIVTVLVFTRLRGLEGAGIAFMVLYVVYAGVLLALVKWIAGGGWNRHTVTIAALAMGVMGLLMLDRSVNPDSRIALAADVLGVCAVGGMCSWQLLRGSRNEARHERDVRRAA